MPIPDDAVFLDDAARYEAYCAEYGEEAAWVMLMSHPSLKRAIKALLDQHIEWYPVSDAIIAQWMPVLHPMSQTDEGRAALDQFSGLVERGWDPEKALRAVIKLSEIHKPR